jgi:hypothetical protein
LPRLQTAIIRIVEAGWLGLAFNIFWGELNNSEEALASPGLPSNTVYKIPFLPLPNVSKIKRFLSMSKALAGKATSAAKPVNASARSVTNVPIARGISSTSPTMSDSGKLAFIAH